MVPFLDRVAPWLSSVGTLSLDRSQRGAWAKMVDVIARLKKGDCRFHGEWGRAGKGLAERQSVLTMKGQKRWLLTEVFSRRKPRAQKTGIRR